MLYLRERERESARLLGATAVTFCQVRGLVRERRSQSLLISGESGAGKTETVKYALRRFLRRLVVVLSRERPLRRFSNPKRKVLRRGNGAAPPQGASGAPDPKEDICEESERYCRYLSRRSARESAGSGAVSVDELVLRSSPVLEAFANAKTARNDNSSRFGKYIQVFADPREPAVGYIYIFWDDILFWICIILDSEVCLFLPHTPCSDAVLGTQRARAERGAVSPFTRLSGRVTSASITSYLLEKVRVVEQLAGERNYHAFYQLVKAEASPLAESHTHTQRRRASLSLSLSLSRAREN